MTEILNKIVNDWWNTGGMELRNYLSDLSGDNSFHEDLPVSDMLNVYLYSKNNEIRFDKEAKEYLLKDVCSELADRILATRHGVSVDELFDADGNFYEPYQDEFNRLYDILEEKMTDLANSPPSNFIFKNEFLKKREEATKSFVDYFVEKRNIDTKAIQCIRTHGWGNKAVLRIEYADFHKDYKPIRLAKQYLIEKYGFSPKSLNFNNPHYDRIGCSILYAYEVSKEDFDTFSELPSVMYSKFHENENCGELEFEIHNREQRELSYKNRLYEYFNI